MDERLLPQIDPAAPALLLSPHFDDAVLSCWGLLSNGQPLYTAVVFSAPPESDWAGAAANGRDEADFMLDRVAETQFLYSLAGRQPLFLPFVPARYRSDDPDPAAIMAALGKQVPEISAVYAPAALCDHPDHLLLRELAVDLHRLGLPVFLYAEMPVACSRGWPALVTPGKGEENTRHIVAEWRVRLGDIEGLELTAPIITSLGFDRSIDKQRLAKTLAGQLSGEGPIDPQRALNTLLDPGVSRYEVCWALDRAA